jgi:anti-sigma B factor antagonist
MSATTQHDEFRPFTVDVHPQREVVRVAPVGDIDLATVGGLRARIEELLSSGFTRVTLDLQGVTFMDSTGLRLVLELVQASRDDQWELSVTEVPSAVQRVFELSGVLDTLALGELRCS